MNSSLRTSAGIAPADGPAAWYCPGDSDAAEPEAHSCTSIVVVGFPPYSCAAHQPRQTDWTTGEFPQLSPCRPESPDPLEPSPPASSWGVQRWPCSSCHQMADVAGMTTLRSGGSPVAYVHRIHGCKP